MHRNRSRVDPSTNFNGISRNEHSLRRLEIVVNPKGYSSTSLEAETNIFVFNKASACVLEAAHVTMSGDVRRQTKRRRAQYEQQVR